MTAAIAYLPGLPTPPSATTGIVWRYAVIHCLPGIYAAVDQGATGAFTPGAPPNFYHNPNGLVANQETFPIDVPDNVSIQGTSALNTIFFGNYDPSATNPPPATSAFRFGAVAGSTGAGSFIDKVAICGFDYPGALNVPSGAGVYCGRTLQAAPTATNCFIFCNIVGILLDAPTQLEPVTDWHTPIIVNNTIAWNRCGIWNGMSQNQVNSRGRAAPVLFNNVIDMSPPFAAGTDIWARTMTPNPASGVNANGVTCFEGLGEEDLLIETTGGTTPVADENFNAYQNSIGAIRFQTNLAISSLPPTAPRASRTAPPNPTIDITPYAGTGPAAARGVLFVRDLMLNGAVYNLGADQDRSPHDWRLSPAMALPTGTPAAGGRNLLVERGWSPQPPVWDWFLRMQNGRSLTAAPGSFLSNFDHTPWDFDADGFGNPRIHDHPIYSGVVVDGTASGPIDIGADELGELVVAGYRFLTTRFIALPLEDPPVLPPALLPMDNRYLWNLGLPATAVPAPPLKTWVERAMYQRVYTSPDDPWNAPGYSFARPTFGATYVYSATEADITPHLLPDLHPYWKGPLVGPVANPIWQAPRGDPITCGSTLYNPHLYGPPFYGNANPPGTYLPSTSYLWLDTAAGTATRFYVPHIAANPPIWASFDPWCRAQTGTPPTGFHDTLSSTMVSTDVWSMKRFSLEHEFAAWSGTQVDRNLQSFSVYVRP